MLHLARLRLEVLPVGVYEADGRLCLNFGQSYILEMAETSSVEARDAWARQVVRSRIKELLPA
jgi:hypothetical protein